MKYSHLIPLACITLSLAFTPKPYAQAASGDSAKGGEGGAVDKGDVVKGDDDKAWGGLLGDISTPRSDASGAVAAANLAKDFYEKHPGSPHAIEARRLEAVMLIQAASSGDATTQARMSATVQAFRSDPKVPEFERAVVAGTFEFTDARGRIKSEKDMYREHETVARGLIKEFPTQPQGYISLLTQAGLRDGHSARALALEVVNAKVAPAEVRTAAQRFVTRIDIVGAPIAELLGPDEAKSWVKGKPGLILFWATWSPDSIALAQTLAGRVSTAENIVSVCLDRDHDGMAAIAKAKGIPGRVIYLFEGLKDEVAVRLGADAAPLLYLVGSDGRVTDVNGLVNLEQKLGALGL